jgi:hypothetical protein
MLDQALVFIKSVSGQTTILAIVVETVLRLVKSDKPLSIAHAVAATISKIGDICSAVAALLDKVLPQNLK